MPVTTSEKTPNWPDYILNQVIKARKTSFLKDKYYKIVSSPSDREARRSVRREMVVFVVQELLKDDAFGPREEMSFIPFRLTDRGGHIISMTDPPYQITDSGDHIISLSDPVYLAMFNPNTGEGVLVVSM